ncbi:uncharacterized protein [Physcomitrium patens]|uniref:AB hydrolase-1 domain-containing protein n=2 Tax=Physcomitrium patens TaxID=3218 RepID=A0A2K1IM95_PHYPA|nr:uncharacterized protein LOC112274780 [Physcomitrium patens]PNR30402.1 hypothetical protein PHYPA_026718 [Physcomitrium patens]|eukprot:XP_024360308.1 uncharacterized protein LOC112274780 [Physcomitrella patens]
MGRESGFGSWIVGMKTSQLEHRYEACGLKSQVVEVDTGTTLIRCWVPWEQPESGLWSAGASEKPAVLFLHDFLMDGTFGWEKQIEMFTKEFNVYVPNLVFFGGSSSTSTEKTEAFQADCMVKMLHALEVYNEVMVVGAGYGGLVAFWMAHLYPKFVTKVVFVASGIHMTPTSQKMLLAKFDYDHISELLLPTTATGLKNLASVATTKPVYRLPTCVCKGILHVFIDKHRHEKVELLNKMDCGVRGGPPLPHLPQEKCLIIWGENDLVTSVELAFKLKLHLGSSTDLVVLEKCGHFPQVENPNSFNRISLNFLKSTN